MHKRTLNLFGLLIILGLLLSACQTATQEAPAPVEATEAVTVVEEPPPAPEEIGPITVWTKFNDQNPQNTQDEWLAAMLASIKSEAGLDVSNVFVPYNEINTKLNLAVQAGGDVPTVSYMDSQQLGFYYNNGSLQDITDYVKSAPWYSDLNPAALASCTGPDGKIYCVPSNMSSRVNYYWKEAYPNGPPTTTDELLAAAPRFKDEGKFVITFKGSEQQGAEIFYFSTIKSFGGNFGDAEGKAAWATPETVKAVEFFRELFANGYAPEIDLAAGWDNELPWTDGIASMFPAGSWSYVYQYPLTSYGGTKYDLKSESIPAALDAGDIGVIPPLAAPGGKPYSLVSASAWAVPVGSPSVVGAQAFINYQMETTRNADFAFAYGGLPALLSSNNDPRYANSTYWQTVLDITTKFGVGADPLIEYDKSVLKLGDTIVRLIQNPELDILSELQKAQDEINSGL
jgi:multiple sugar transport system substrate-binding protein